VRVQGVVRLDRYSEPQPDLALLRPRPDFYASRQPLPADVLLLIEVADSTLAKDRSVKAKLYARAGIAAYWVVDVAARAVWVHSGPSPAGYQAIRRLGDDEELPVPGACAGALLVREVTG
jgi:Uma2 family endonuclease